MVILLVDSDQKVLDWEAKRLAESQGAVTASLHSSAKSAIDFAKITTSTSYIHGRCYRICPAKSWYAE